MDPTSAVRTDTLPAVATVLVPGAVASGAYIWFGILSVPEVGSFLQTREILTTVVLILLWVGIGFVVESTGSYVEVHLIDRRRADHDKMVKTWWQYLRLAWINEPVGQRYLRKLLVGFKFELNMFTASVFAIPGVLLLKCGDHVASRTFYGLFVGFVVAACLFFYFAKDTASVLATVRKELARGIIKK